MSSYSLYYKFDSNTGAQIDYASNGAVVLVIETSTNLVNWAGLATNQNAVPDFSYYYSDNANQPWAVYRIKTP